MNYRRDLSFRNPLLGLPRNLQQPATVRVGLSPECSGMFGRRNFPVSGGQTTSAASALKLDGVPRPERETSDTVSAALRHPSGQICQCFRISCSFPKLPFFQSKGVGSHSRLATLNIFPQLS